jgi:hypothetical protein
MAETIIKDETSQETPRKRGPGRPRKNPDSPIRTARYHIYQEREDGTLAHLGEAQARNAEMAASDFIKNHEDMQNDQQFVVVPNRNISRVSAKVETTKRVRVTTD